MNLCGWDGIPSQKRIPVTCFVLCWIAASHASDTDSAIGGFEAAKTKCAGCHVIGEDNRMGGIGNAHSFQSMAQHEDVRERFSTFYARRPHPVFVRFPGFAKWSNAVS